MTIRQVVPSPDFVPPKPTAHNKGLLTYPSGRERTISYPIDPKSVVAKAADEADSQGTGILMDGNARTIDPEKATHIVFSRTKESGESDLFLDRISQKGTHQIREADPEVSAETEKSEGGVEAQKEAEEAPAATIGSEEEEVFGLEELTADIPFVIEEAAKSVSASLEAFSAESVRDEGKVASSSQPESPEQVEKAITATEASTQAVSALRKAIPSAETPPSDEDTSVNGHRLFVSKNLVVVGDVKASGSEAEATKEINDTLEAVLASPKVSETVKQNITACRAQGKVRTLDSERTKKVEKQAPTEAAKRLSEIKDQDVILKTCRQIKEKIEEARNNLKTPLVDVLGPANAYRQVVGDEMLARHPELKLSGRVFDLGNGHMIEETASGRTMFNRHLDKEKARELITNSPISPEEKDELLKKLEEGTLEIPTKAEEDEIQRRTEELIQEFTAWIKAELAKLQKEEETSKLAKGLSAPKGIFPIRMPSRETIEKMPLIDLAGLIVLRGISKERARQEAFLTEERRRKDYEHREEIKYLEKEAALTAQYFIKEYFKELLIRGDYSEQELKREVATWLLTSREKAR